MMKNLPSVSEPWKHFKGGEYRIMGFAWGAEGDELVLRVLYQGLTSQRDNVKGPVYSRTLSNFLGPVDTRANARFVKCPN